MFIFPDLREVVICNHVLEVLYIVHIQYFDYFLSVIAKHERSEMAAMMFEVPVHRWYLDALQT